MAFGALPLFSWQVKRSVSFPFQALLGHEIEPKGYLTLPNPLGLSRSFQYQAFIDYSGSMPNAFIRYLF